jgi:hypothetical protein
MKIVYTILIVQPEENRPLGRPRRSCEDNIKNYLKEVGCSVWTGEVQDRDQ